MIERGRGSGVSSSSSSSWDLQCLLQYILSAIAVAVGLHFFFKKFASNYFIVDANFHDPDSISTSLADAPICALCGKHATKKCSRCKSLRYCSEACQQSHWKSEHKMKCKAFSSAGTVNLARTGPADKTTSIALVPGSGRGTSRPVKHLKNVLFPYDEFIEIFNCDEPGFPPCGLLNCGNSCFANVVLQCLTFTKPLIAYLLEKGHRRECSHNDWCFLCEFEIHVEKARLSSQAFSPMTILSRLPNIGGTLGYGRQEDAHEFMRFAIDTMQSICLDEFGGEKAVPPNLQETTLIQHIFGGHLQSEVICTRCEKNSSQYENMMDLTVEIHGDAASLEECLDQFTVKEWLHGENMYKCDGCKDYVKAWKRLTVKQAPNILTIALKRFQSGRFGKLNKRVTFPETLDLSPYMSEAGDGSDIYKLFAVVVHIDMLNASYFGHYICYIKDFRGNWYRIDDWKVISVELKEVLSQGAYMLLYSRVTARPSALQTIESLETAEEQTVKPEVEPGRVEQAKCLSNMENVTCSRGCGVYLSDSCPELMVSSCGCESSAGTNFGENGEESEDKDVIGVAIEASCAAVESSYIPSSQAVEDLMDIDMSRSNSCSSVLEEISGCNGGEGDIYMVEADLSSDSPNGFSCYNNNPSVSIDYQNMKEDCEHVDVIKCKPITANGNGHYGNGYANEKKYANPAEDGIEFPGVGSFSTETSSAEMHQLKRRLPFYTYESDKGNGVRKVEMSGDKLII